VVEIAFQRYGRRSGGLFFSALSFFAVFLVARHAHAAAKR